MLLNIQNLEGYAISATDGLIGEVMDFYFDDDAWVVRYLVVKTRDDPERDVLISPISIGHPDHAGKVFPISVTRSQVNSSPNIDTDRPVSRQQEMGYLGYYGYGNYWGGGGLWGAGMFPDILQAGAGPGGRADAANHLHDDPHLRSINDVMRYYVHATDGDIGHIVGFLVDEKSWAIRYVIVNTSNWWLGHQVIVSTEWVANVNWAESTVSLDMTRQAIKDSPAYDHAAVLDRDYETAIHAHYGREGYWLPKARKR